LNHLTNVIEDYEKKFDVMHNRENKLIDELNSYKDSIEKYKKQDSNNNNSKNSNFINQGNNKNNITYNERENLNKVSSNKSKLSIDFNDVFFQ